MEKRETNRALQRGIPKEYQRGVKLIDIDEAIATYMSTVIIPDVMENDIVIKVPLIYGNAERWVSARKDGYLKDKRGKIQVPLVMFKRNTIERDGSLPQFKEVNVMPAVKQYSNRNRYERFSLVNGAQPVYEYYNVSVPDYITVTYEVIIWTSFTEQMNKIVEAFQYATDRYWGTEKGFKFRSRLDSFDTQQEVGDATERIIRTTFTLSVNAYLLPEKYDETPTVKKSFSPKRVVWGVETDLTGNMFTNPNLYNEYQSMIDFVVIRGSKLATFVNSNTVKLTNVSKPALPPELAGTFDVNNWYSVYINGTFYAYTYYTDVYNSSTNEITFTFTGAPVLTISDEVAITGKFIEL